MVVINKEDINRLEEVLAKYPDILSEFGIKDKIIKAFNFEKPITSIEIENGDKEKVAQIMKDLDSFFFVG